MGACKGCEWGMQPGREPLLGGVKRPLLARVERVERRGRDVIGGVLSLYSVLVV